MNHPENQSAQRCVVYRPAKGIGIGHFIVSIAGYHALARHLDARLLVTTEGTVFPMDFITHAFETDLSAYGRIHFDDTRLRRELDTANLDGKRLAIIGHKDAGNRAVSEFPGLKNAEFLDHRDHISQIAPDYLEQFDTIYVDSVLPNYELTTALAPLGVPLRCSPAIRDAARELTGERPYLAVHVRHGNGEFLNGRTSGDDKRFTDLLDHLGTAARLNADGCPIYCLSDNSNAAQHLAQLCGGRVIGREHLPMTPFQKWFRQHPDAAPAGLERMMLDLACLAGARKIIGSYSQFSFAAHILAEGDNLQIVTPRGTSYRVSDAEIGYLSERAQ